MPNRKKGSRIRKDVHSRPYLRNTAARYRSDFIASDIKAMRESKGLNQRQLAELAGVSYGNLMKYESRSMVPAPSELKKITKALGYSVPLDLYYYETGQLKTPVKKSKAGRIEDITSLLGDLSLEDLDDLYRQVRTKRNLVKYENI